MRMLIHRVGNDGLESLTNVERNAFLVWCYPAAVNDGGHASFFYNTYGDFAHETVTALRETGLVEFSHILALAISQFPDARVPRELDDRNAAFDSLSHEAHDAMGECDKAFFELGDVAIMDRLWDYWRQSAT